PYAILSYTWWDEVTNLWGYCKIDFCAGEAARDGLQHFWIDTCCIDKANDAGRHGAISSIYGWYHGATVCYAFLTDVTGLADLPRSKWWARGWTLQARNPAAFAPA
ncbi:uncharacterized protein B0I36DRAFT_398223, partial [Microdochium trichocladiopsis]